MGLKTENVEKVLVLHYFFKSAGLTNSLNPEDWGSLWRRIDVENKFLIKYACVYIQDCASCIGGEHIFIKFMKTHGRKMINGAERA